MSTKKDQTFTDTDTFCALPFQHACIGPEGTARPCCVTGDMVTDHGAPMSVTTHSMDAIWNSAYMRNFRRAMLKGEPLKACEVCYSSERTSGHSYRTMVGLKPVGDPVSKSDIAKLCSQPGYRVATSPSFVKLEISNLCNLKCRMCKGAYSSQIERDPVHSRWNGSDSMTGITDVDPLHAIWRGETARIGPEPRIGVRRSGFYPHDLGTTTCWTDGHAILTVPLSEGTELRSLEILLDKEGAANQRFEILIDGFARARGVLTREKHSIDLDLRNVKIDRELTIEILCNRTVGPAGEYGLPVSSILLHRQVSALERAGPSRPILPAREAAGPWYNDDRIVFGEVLKDLDALERLYITGGEPLINDRVAEILDHLIDKGVAQRIWLELSTNCTFLDDRIIERLKKFKHIDLLLSLDAVGNTYEYIRYPARWKNVDANVRRLREEFGAQCTALPVVQVYNVLRLTDLYDYCDALEIEVVESPLTWPHRLSIQYLPTNVRKAAAAKIVEHCRGAADNTKIASRLSLAKFLNELETDADPKFMREMMIFTNDLDASRGQSFASVHPDMVKLLAAAGYDWIAETRHAQNGHPRQAARDRLYATV